MPALGGAAFRPKKHFALRRDGGGASSSSNNNSDNDDYNEVDDSDLPVLDDATRKMIMRDIQRGKIPTFASKPDAPSSQQHEQHQQSYPGAFGTGIQGASYLLQEKEKREQELEAMMKQVRLSGGKPQPPPTQHSSSHHQVSQQAPLTTAQTNLKRIRPEPTSKSTGTQPSLPPPPTTTTTSTTAPPAKRLIVHQKSSDEYVPELNNQKQPSNNKQQQQPSVPPSNPSLDPELIDVMASRLRFLEKQNTFLQSEVKDKSIKLSNVQNKLTDTEEVVAKLQTERVILAEKIASMSRFLADYGLKWVGDDEAKKLEHATSAVADQKNNNNNNKKKFDLYSGSVSSVLKKSEDQDQHNNKHDKGTGFDGDSSMNDMNDNNTNSSSNRTPPKQTPRIEKVDPSAVSKAKNTSNSNNNHQNHPFDFDKFSNMCAALSAQVSQHFFDNKNINNGKKSSSSSSSNTIVSLRPREIVHVTVFADGITVAGGPFRPFGWALCDAFVRDVMDGYFPYEYRGRYPDGFSIDVIDKRGERYLVVPGGEDHRHSSLDPQSLASAQNSPSKYHNKNRIRTLQDSPYSLKKTQQQQQSSKNDSGNNNNIGGASASSSLFNKNTSGLNIQPNNSNKGRMLGGMRHAGASSGNVATRDIILKRIPTRYVTASGRIINPAAGIAEFLNLPTDKFSSTFVATAAKNNQNNNNNRNGSFAMNGAGDAAMIPQTPPRFSMMKNYKGPQIVVVASSSSSSSNPDKKSEVEKNLDFGKALNDDSNNDNLNKNKIRIRALFPSSGDQVDIVIDDYTNFSVEQLQERILSTAASQGIHLRPPVDLNDYLQDGAKDFGSYEMEFIVRNKKTYNSSSDATNTTTTTITRSFSVNGNDDNDNDQTRNEQQEGMGSRQASEFLSREYSNKGGDMSGINNRKRETVVVRWRKRTSA